MGAADFWHDSNLWLAVGLVGQGAFFVRFLVQWLASERAGRSYLPMSFWYLSIFGSIVLLIYAVHREEPVFFLGHAFGWVVYVRNLMLLRRKGERHTLSSG